MLYVQLHLEKTAEKDASQYKNSALCWLAYAMLQFIYACKDHFAEMNERSTYYFVTKKRKFGLIIWKCGKVKIIYATNSIISLVVVQSLVNHIYFVSWPHNFFWVILIGNS